MVRGTYLPWPVKWGRKNVRSPCFGILHIHAGEHDYKIEFFHTSLREESAESVIGVGLLALLGEESIGLIFMLVADAHFSE